MSDLLQRLRKAARELAEAGYPRDAAREQEAAVAIERLRAIGHIIFDAGLAHGRSVPPVEGGFVAIYVDSLETATTLHNLLLDAARERYRPREVKMQRYELLGDDMQAAPDGAWVRAADADDAIERLQSNANNLQGETIRLESAIERLRASHIHCDHCGGSWLDDGINSGCYCQVVKRLRAALQPFAKVAAGIPHNWPGECHLRVDGLPYGSTSREWLAYWGVNDGCTTLPTIAEWRAAEKALQTARAAADGQQRRQSDAP